VSSIEARLQLLEDERAILDVLYTYGHGFDYNLEREFADCWTEDAQLRYTGLPPLSGRAAILEFFRVHTHAPDMYHKHVVVEPRIRINGDRATVDSYYARLDRYEDGPHICSFGRYRDVLVRSADGRWRFQERVAESEARRDVPTNEGTEPLPDDRGLA
jgi:ketosteroid isomerase-like protein